MFARLRSLGILLEKFLQMLLPCSVAADDQDNNLLIPHDFVPIAAKAQ